MSRLFWLDHEHPNRIKDLFTCRRDWRRIAVRYDRCGARSGLSAHSNCISKPRRSTS